MNDLRVGDYRLEPPDDPDLSEMTDEELETAISAMEGYTDWDQECPPSKRERLWAEDYLRELKAEREYRREQRRV